MASAFGGPISIAAAVLGAAVALFFAATMVVMAILATALLALTAVIFGGGRRVRARVQAEVIEARNVGGHSWVAYGWDRRR